MLTNDNIFFEDVNITNVLSKWLLDFQENELCSNAVHIENDSGKTSVQYYFFYLYNMTCDSCGFFYIFYTGIKHVEMIKVHINFVGSFPPPIYWIHPFGLLLHVSIVFRMNLTEYLIYTYHLLQKHASME